MTSSDDSNLVLDVIEGPRLYVPPPNAMIVKIVEGSGKTKGGLHLPGGGKTETAAGSLMPLGEVVAMGRPAGEKWPEYVAAHGAPFTIGNLVYFTTELLPMFRLHSGYWVIPWENVIVEVQRTFEPGGDVAVTPGDETMESLYYAPPAAGPTGVLE